MSTTVDRDPEQEVACPIFFIDPDEEPELHLPQDEVALEQPLLSEAGETEEGFSSNTSDWE